MEDTETTNRTNENKDLCETVTNVHPSVQPVRLSWFSQHPSFFVTATVMRGQFVRCLDSEMFFQSELAVFQCVSVRLLTHARTLISSCTTWSEYRSGLMHSRGQMCWVFFCLTHQFEDLDKIPLFLRDNLLMKHNSH